MSMVDFEQSATGRQKAFYGKYRGTVVNNVDPKNMGRIQVLVPDVSSIAISSWAMPCVPWGGMKMGTFGVPLLGAGVWVEFEQGDSDFPIWTGCYWGSGAETPSGSSALPPLIPGFTIETPTTNMFQISDLPGPTGGIQLKTRLGAMISITDVGITISNGMGASITLTGPTVDINSGALTVV